MKRARVPMCLCYTQRAISNRRDGHLLHHRLHLRLCLRLCLYFGSLRCEIFRLFRRFRLCKLLHCIFRRYIRLCTVSSTTCKHEGESQNSRHNPFSFHTSLQLILSRFYFVSISTVCPLAPMRSILSQVDM